MQLPDLVQRAPAPGKRVVLTAPEYKGAAVHHLVYLPTDWHSDWKARGQSWPVVVEYTGNYYPTSGSTGEVEGAALGYGLCGGRFIWVVLPYVAEDHLHNEVRWWGDEKATVEYAKTNVPRICAEFGGDERAVFVCGFSRGAIGVNYVGLYDDEIADLWCGFVSHDHYDGVRAWQGTHWGMPLADYRQRAVERLQRLKGRPALVCQRDSTQDIQDYLKDQISLDAFTFLDVPVTQIFPELPDDEVIHPHTDRWLLKPSGSRDCVYQWVDDVVRTVC